MHTWKTESTAWYTYEPQSTTVYKGDGSGFALTLAVKEIRWYEIREGG